MSFSISSIKFIKSVPRRRIKHGTGQDRGKSGASPALEHVQVEARSTKCMLKMRTEAFSNDFGIPIYSLFNH